jgi:hypothetical protein
MGMQTTLWIGTRKGAFRARSKDRKSWKIEGPCHPGNEINHVVADPRDPQRVYATVNSGWFGSHLHASADGGKTWKPSEKGLELAGIPDQSIKRLWHIEPGHADEPGVVYVGADPGALFSQPGLGRNVGAGLLADAASDARQMEPRGRRDVPALHSMPGQRTNHRRDFRRGSFPIIR